MQMHLFKGIQDTFENIDWNFRDTKVCGFLGYLFKILYDFRDTFPNTFRDTGYWGYPFQGLLNGDLVSFYINI